MSKPLLKNELNSDQTKMVLKSFKKINSYLKDLGITDKVGIDILKEMKNSKENIKVDGGLFFGITQNGLIRVIKKDLILTNAVQKRLNIPNTPYSLLLTEGLYNGNIIMNFQLKKNLTEGYLIEDTENFKTNLAPLLKKISLTFGAAFLMPPKVSDKIVVVNETSETKEANGDTIVGTYDMSIDTMKLILAGKTTKIAPNYLTEENYIYGFDGFDNVTEQEKIIQNGDNLELLNIKEGEKKGETISVAIRYIYKEVEIKEDDLLDKKLFLDKGDGLYVVRIKLKNGEEKSIYYNSKTGKYYEFADRKEEMYVNGEKILTPKEFGITKMSKDLWDNKTALKENQEKSQEYIKYLAQKLNTPEKISTFLATLVGYFYDDRTSYKYYGGEVYPEGLSGLNVVMQYDNKGVIHDDCDGYASLIKSILTEQGLPAVVNTSRGWGGGHAYTQLHYYDTTKQKWIGMTIGTRGVDIESGDSLSEVQNKLYDKYSYMTWQEKQENAQKFGIYTSEKGNLINGNGNTKWGEIDISTDNLDKNPLLFNNTIDFVQHTVDYETNTVGQNFYRNVNNIYMDNLKKLVNDSEMSDLDELLNSLNNF